MLLGLVFLGHAARLYQIPLLNTLDSFVYDTRLRLTMPGGVDERIVILDIDEASLARSRSLAVEPRQDGGLVDRLFNEYGSCCWVLTSFLPKPTRARGSIPGVAGERRVARRWRRSTRPCAAFAARSIMIGALPSPCAAVRSCWAISTRAKRKHIAAACCLSLRSSPAHSRGGTSPFRPGRASA